MRTDDWPTSRIKYKNKIKKPNKIKNYKQYKKTYIKYKPKRVNYKPKTPRKPSP